jgi:hypothetical protein
MSGLSTQVDCGVSTTKAWEEGAKMIIIEVNYHLSDQQIAFMDKLSQIGGVLRQNLKRT